MISGQLMKGKNWFAFLKEVFIVLQNMLVKFFHA